MRLNGLTLAPHTALRPGRTHDEASSGKTTRHCLNRGGNR